MGEAQRRKASGEYPERTEKPTRAPKAPLESVTWEIVGDLAAHPTSDDVLNLLGEMREEHEDSLKGKPMAVLLEDGNRQPIIRATTMGLDVFLQLIGGLQDLDLVYRLSMPLGQR